MTCIGFYKSNYTWCWYEILTLTPKTWHLECEQMWLPITPPFHAYRLFIFKIWGTNVVERVHLIFIYLALFVRVHLYSLVQLAHVLNCLNSCALAVVLNGLTDFSPSLSPSGLWTAVASYGTPNGWAEEVEDFPTHIYVFLTRDRTHRVKVAEFNGWPSWVDDRTLYFHRRGQDQWWSVYRAILPSNAPVSLDSVIIQRVTPPGLQAFTPPPPPQATTTSTTVLT